MANISTKQKEMSLKIILEMQFNYINLKILKSQIIIKLSIAIFKRDFTECFDKECKFISEKFNLY